MKLFTLIIATAIISLASFTATAQISSVNSSVKFNPMGIANGVIKVKMNNQPTGVYTLQILDENGTILGVKTINHETANNVETADLGKTFAGGTYRLEVIYPDNTKTGETIMLLM
ncbi:hypothetical protein [Ferruginibacter albus]|uniref:hypothetical protein n=1 Tax=Ferruginibacter albus TaxID=2875540 RepID=UPI001CC72EA3|nr:hypothetical protein [Ferruginibacter albus]UAY53458.1 hypothetical protein K9M53_07230 [Ferruginibacter albus]